MQSQRKGLTKNVIDDSESEDDQQGHQENIDKEDDSFHPQNSENLSKDNKIEHDLENEDELETDSENKDDSNKIDGLISKDFQIHTQNINWRMDQSLQKICTIQDGINIYLYLE